MGAGDRLASGAKSAQFSAGNTRTQIEWDFMFMEPRKFKRTYGISKKQFEAIREKKQ